MALGNCLITHLLVVESSRGYSCHKSVFRRLFLDEKMSRPLRGTNCVNFPAQVSLLMAFSTLRVLSREAFPIVRTTSVNGLVASGKRQNGEFRNLFRRTNEMTNTPRSFCFFQIEKQPFLPGSHLARTARTLHDKAVKVSVKSNLEQWMDWCRP